ncbi:Uncharacterised protein [Serratia rubidaea]|nr:Uncharacterised protein [Serratia rubidaea]
MSSQPKAKTSDLHHKLVGYIDSGEIPDVGVIEEILRDASYLLEPERSYIRAMVHVAKRDHSGAMQFFEQSLRYDDVRVALNYLAYLGTSAHNYTHRLEIYRLEELYHNSTMRRIARNASYGIGDSRRVRQYTLKMAALLDGEQKQRMMSEGEAMMQRIQDFKELTSLTQKDVEDLCDTAEGLANAQNVNCIGVSYFIDTHGDCAYIIDAETEDPEILSELNFELACVLADEKYIDKAFTSWFRSVSRKDGEYQ